MWDVVIVGGGPAGLSAALVLGRSRRRTLVLDDGAPRNAPADAAHSVFTRDGTPPLELLEVARTQLHPYDSVELRPVAATTAHRGEQALLVRDANGQEHHTRRLLLATGVEDLLPDVDGLRRFWGRTVFHCPYCHGWELRDRRIAAVTGAASAMDVVQLLRGWSHDLVLCIDGAEELTEETRAHLGRLRIPIREERLVAVRGATQLEALVFADGSTLACDAVFLRPPQQLRGSLAANLGCVLTDGGLVQVGTDWQTTVPGVYAAGDMVSPMQQVILAAASGSAAAITLNHALLEEDLARASGAA